MALQDNTFENQSAINDENKGGGALPDSTGGATGGASGSSLGSLSDLANAKESILGKLNKIPLSSFFEGGKFKFPTNLLSQLNIKALSDSIMDALSKGMSISDIFKNGIQGIFSIFVSQLKLDVDETWAFLKKATGSFSQALLSKTFAVLLNNVYISDAQFLAGLYPVSLGGKHKTGLSYKNGYIRELCLKHDMPISLAFIDDALGIKYSHDNNKSINDAIKAAKNGSIHVVYYIMDQINKEIKDLESCYPLPKKYSRKDQLELETKYNNLISDTESILNGLMSGLNSTELEEFKNSAQYKILTDKTESYKKEIDKLFLKTEDKYREDPMYEKIQNHITTGKRNLCKIFKNTLVYSYSNLTRKEVEKFLKDFDLEPYIFGTNDKKYGKAFCIKNNDLNVMVPIIKPKNSTVLGGFTNITKKSPMIPDVETRFIYPRNAHIKSIYIYLASRSLHGNNFMNNKEFYERLRLPVYDDILNSLDAAYGGLYKTGLGKIAIGTINTIDEACYSYAKSVEHMLYRPADVTFLKYNDLKSLPAPSEEEKTTNSEKRKEVIRRADSNMGSSKANLAKAAIGPTAPTEISFVNDLLDSLTTEDIVSLLKSYGYTDEEIANMNDNTRKTLLKEKWSSNNTSPETIFSLISIDSLKAYLVKTGSDSSELTAYTKEQLINLSISMANKTKVDESSSPVLYLAFDDMKRYLRKYEGKKEGELADRSLEYLSATIKKTFTNQRRKIYYPKSFEINGYDAEGFPILGYPDSTVIQESASSKKYGNWSSENPNGYPVNENGLICPIIGYSASGKAMYGTPIFYGDIDPIADDARGLPVFAFYKDNAILDDVNRTESEILAMILENENKISDLRRYISNGASGIIKTSYEKSIKGLTSTVEQLKNTLSKIEIKPIIGYDEFGTHIFGQMNYINKVLSPDNIECVGYDENGNIIYEYDEDGHTILGNDSNGTYIYGAPLLKPLGYDKDGNIIYTFDKNNNPILGFTKEKKPVIQMTYKDGKVISYKVSEETIKKPIGMTDDGQKIYEYNVNGKPIVSYDVEGKPVILLFNSNDEINLQVEKCESTIDNCVNKVYPTLSNYLNEKKFSNTGSEETIKEYIKTNMISDELMGVLNSDSERENYITDAQMQFLYSYQIKVSDEVGKKTTYETILNDESVVVVGVDSENVPILGKSLIVEKIPAPSKLKYSSSDATDFGFTNSDSETQSTNVLDKHDIDFDTEYAQAEAEIIKEVNGNNLSLIIELIY